MGGAAPASRGPRGDPPARLTRCPRARRYCRPPLWGEPVTRPPQSVQVCPGCGWSPPPSKVPGDGVGREAGLTCQVSDGPLTILLGQRDRPQHVSSPLLQPLPLNGVRREQGRAQGPEEAWGGRTEGQSWHQPRPLPGAGHAVSLGFANLTFSYRLQGGSGGVGRAQSPPPSAAVGRGPSPGEHLPSCPASSHGKRGPREASAATTSGAATSVWFSRPGSSCRPDRLPPPTSRHRVLQLQIWDATLPGNKGKKN